MSTQANSAKPITRSLTVLNVSKTTHSIHCQVIAGITRSAEDVRMGHAIRNIWIAKFSVEGLMVVGIT